MKSLRSRQPSVRTHGLRRIGKVFVPKPKPERVWNVHTDWEEPWSRSHCVFYRSMNDDAVMLVRFDEFTNKEKSREVFETLEDYQKGRK